MTRLLLVLLALGLGFSVAGCNSSGFAQPASPYGPSGGGNWMAGGGG